MIFEINIGMFIGFIWIKNFMNGYFVCFVIIKFCGLLIIVIMLFNVELMFVCINKLCKNVWNFFKIYLWLVILLLLFIFNCFLIEVLFEVIWW